MVSLLASWDVLGSTATAPATGQALKEGAIGGFTTGNNFFYTAPELVEGIGLNVSYTPSGTGRPDGSVSYALSYTGVEGLTIGYAEDDNGLKGTSKLKLIQCMLSMHLVHLQLVFNRLNKMVEILTMMMSSAHGVTYQVSDDLTIGYHASERQFGDKTADQETKSIQAAYTMGGMTLKAQSVSMDNTGGSTSARDDVDGYKLSVSFAF